MYTIHPIVDAHIDTARVYFGEEAFMCTESSLFGFQLSVDQETGKGGNAENKQNRYAMLNVAAFHYILNRGSLLLVTVHFMRAKNKRSGGNNERDKSAGKRMPHSFAHFVGQPPKCRDTDYTKE